MNVKNSDVAVVIPAYNEEKSIRAIVQAVLTQVSQVIVVDDGSSDHTLAQISDLPIILLKNPKNLGKGASLVRGFQAALSLPVRGIITLDADTQHNPADIPALINAMQDQPEKIIIAARVHNKENAPKSRYRANQWADFFISWAAGQRITDTQSGYRLYPARFLKDYLVDQHHQQFAFETEILIDCVHHGYPVTSIAIYSHYPKNARASHYRPIKDTLSIIALVSKKILCGRLHKK